MCRRQPHRQPASGTRERTRPGEVPDQPGSTDARVADQVLRPSGAIGPADTIFDSSYTPIGAGIGMMGDLARLQLRYAGGPFPCPQ